MADAAWAGLRFSQCGVPMLQRLLFVAGMTIGVMAPLFWAAYVSVPAFRTGSNRAGAWGQRDAIGIALRETPMPQAASRSARTTSSEETAAPVSESPQSKSDLKSVTSLPSPSLEAKPAQVTKPILPQANDRKANQAPPSSENVKPAPAYGVVSRVSIASTLEKTSQRKHPRGAPDAARNEKMRASSKRASPRKTVDHAPLRDGRDMVDLYVGDSCRQRVKIYDDWGGWVWGHRLGCW